MWLKKTVAAIVPASQNKDSIFKVIQELDATGYIDEIVVVDNNVDTETLKQIKKTRARFVGQRKYGVGRSIRAGIKNTKADLIIITDPDGTYRGADISKLLAYSEDFDSVFGSRTHVPLIGKGSGMTFARRIIDDFFGKMVSLLFLSSPLTDVGCILRLTNRKGWGKVAKECTSDSEMFFAQWLIGAAKNKVRFIEIPVNFTASKTFDGKESTFYLAVRGLQIFFYMFKTWLNYVI